MPREIWDEFFIVNTIDVLLLLIYCLAVEMSLATMTCCYLYDEKLQLNSVRVGRKFVVEFFFSFYVYRICRSVLCELCFFIFEIFTWIFDELSCRENWRGYIYLQRKKNNSSIFELWRNPMINRRRLMIIWFVIRRTAVWDFNKWNNYNRRTCDCTDWKLIFSFEIYISQTVCTKPGAILIKSLKFLWVSFCLQVNLHDLLVCSSIRFFFIFENCRVYMLYYWNVGTYRIEWRRSIWNETGFIAFWKNIWNA